MRTNTEGALLLSKAERVTLARFVAGTALIDLADELDWESCPNLDAVGFELLCDEIRGIGNTIIGRLGARLGSADALHAKVTT